MLDGGRGNPYLPWAMNRLLLTLLALMTGLVAQVSPAAAAVRAGGETEIGASAARQVSEAAVQAIAGTPREIAARPGLPVSLADRVARLGLAQTTVLTGIDRARE